METTLNKPLPTLREKLMKSLDELDVSDFDSDYHKQVWADHLIDWLRTENSVRELLAFPGGAALWVVQARPAAPAQNGTMRSSQGASLVQPK